MSTKYKIGDDIPGDVLCNRLDDLSNAVTQGRDSVNREFTMRIPAECDRDADLVLSASARRIRKLEKKLKYLTGLESHATYGGKGIEIVGINTEKKNEQIAKDKVVVVDSLVILQKSIKTLREMKDIQCSNGNWNYDSYMHGMANGIIFALSLFDNKRPDYLEAPETWLKDIPDKEAIASEAVVI